MGNGEGKSKIVHGVGKGKKGGGGGGCSQIRLAVHGQHFNLHPPERQNAYEGKNKRKTRFKNHGNSRDKGQQ